MQMDTVDREDLVLLKIFEITWIMNFAQILGFRQDCQTRAIHSSNMISDQKLPHYVNKNQFYELISLAAHDKGCLPKTHTETSAG